MGNSFVLIFYIAYLKRDVRTKRKILILLYMKPEEVESIQSQIKNVMDEPLVLENNPQIHFTQLAKYWS